MLSLSGHLGDRAAALVDGQLPRDQEERAWQHVLCCPGCRRLVEDQVAAKSLLGGLGETAAPRPSWLDADALLAWEQVRRVERQAARRRHLGIGGGVLTASMVVALAVAGVAGSDDLLSPPPPESVRSELVGPVPGGIEATPSWVGTDSGGETSRAVWADGSRW